eukprot:scaffold2636_cov340-Pavlova_lutheri.AAC.52
MALETPTYDLAPPCILLQMDCVRAVPFSYLSFSFHQPTIREHAVQITLHIQQEGLPSDPHLQERDDPTTMDRGA